MEKEIHSNGGLVPYNQGVKPPINRNLLQLLIAMKVFLLILALSLQVSAAVYSQQITLTVTKAPLQEVMQSISKQSGYNFMFRSIKSKEANPVTVSLHLSSLEDALDQIFKGQPFTYTIDNKIIVISKKKDLTNLLSIENGPIIIKGRVTDKKNQPLVGVNVRIKGATNGTITDENGKYSIIVSGQGVLIFSYIGYRSVERKFTDRAEFNIIMEDVSSQLDQVQVIAYGTTTQRYSTSNISAIKSEDIGKQPVGNILLGIQGRVPGMQLTQSSGVPGADVKVRVQGENSLRNGNEAFYVIDGIPYVPQNLYSGFIGAIPGTGSTLSFLNPSDVESIVVLKDADATAIYGSRAANGAILITTKKGKAGQTKIDVNAQSGWGRPSRMLNLMNTEQYIAMRKEAIKNAGETIGPTDYDVNGTWDVNKNTNWQKKLLNNTANFTNLQASISGGSEGTQFLASGGYMKEGTVFSNQYSDIKGNLRINLNHTSKDKKFDFTISSNYLQDLNRLPIIDLAAAAVTLAPNAPDLYNPDGSINWAPIPGSPNTATFDINPAAALERKYEAKTNNLISNSIIGYKILPGLALKANLGYNRLETYETATFPQSSFAPYVTRNARTANYATKIISSWIIEPQLTYSKSFSFGLIDALLGSSFQSTNKSVMAFTGTNYANDDQLLNPLAAGNITANYNTMKSLYRYNAVFGRINYQAEGKYIVNLSIRRDGSSRFGSENLFHSFYSIGTAWIFSEERWFKDHQSFLSFGKLRFTYGTTGNDQIQDYQYLNLYTNYSSNVVVPYQQTIGLLPSGHSNPYLQWEETKKLNIGIDLGMLNNRLILNANYYRNRSSNQLLEYSLPFLTGFSTVLRNIPALVENSGFELVTNYSPIQTRNFKWQMNINVTIPRNRLVAYPGLEQSSAYSIYSIGKPINIAKVYEYVGVDEKTGYYQFKTVDGKITNNPDPVNDRTKIINLGQTLYGGLNNTFSYKNLEISFLLQFVKQNAQNFDFGSLLPGFINTNQPLNLLDRWQKSGDIKNIQQITTSFDSFNPFIAAQGSDAGYSDASYIRLKTASISYNLPDRWLQKVKISKAQIYIQGQNLFVLTKLKQLDPETLSPTTLPPLRVISIGAQLTF